MSDSQRLPPLLPLSDADEGRALISFLAITRASAERLSTSERTVRRADVEYALSDFFSMESIDLLRYDWTPDTMVEALSEYDFARLWPTVLQEVELTDDIIPDGVPRRFTEEVVKRHGHRWVIHKNDADPFPSNPHAHDYEGDFKLHLGTGELFRNRRVVGKSRPKHLRQLRGLIRFRPLPNLET